MPLFKGKSKADFGHNVKTEMEHGKPQKQALAIAYHMARKHKAHGGEMEPEMCAHGGPVECAEGCYADTDSDGGGDMVGRIMGKRMSEGGKVANSDEIEAGFMPNEFDDLHLRDDLESTYTGENSGDYDSTPGESERMHDMVDRIMMKRRKQSNPRPA